MNDSVNHPKHYTAHHAPAEMAKCIHGTTNQDVAGRQIREAHAHQADCRELQHSLDMPVQLRQGDARIPAESTIRASRELRLQESRRRSGEAKREDHSERLRIFEGPESPEVEPTHRQGSGTHHRDGVNPWSKPSSVRGGASQERKPGRQQTTELGTLEPQSTSRRSGVGSGCLGEGNTDQIQPRVFGDPVNHPPHYTSHPAQCECGRGIECIQITEHMGFCLGNAIKYIWRADLKRDSIEDLRKARWYLDREIARRMQEAT